MRQKLRIILFPDQSNIPSNPATSGFTFSTTDKIFINKTDEFYHVNYKFVDYLKLDMVKFAKALSNMFDKNMPGETFDLAVVCEIEKLKRIPELQKAFLAYSNNISVINPNFKISNINFSQDEDRHSVDADLEDLDDEECDGDCDRCCHGDCEDREFGEVDKSGWHDDDCNWDEDDDEDEDTVDTINQILGMGGGHTNGDGVIYDGSPYSKLKNKMKHDKKTYSSSRILKANKHVKRDVKRHNIIITTGDARDRDEKIIKEFLKDFIPGNSNWIKEYRKTILKRWLNQFAVTKKMAKKMAKKNKEIMANNKKKNNNLFANDVSNATRNIIKRYNSFYDTSK